MNIHIHINGKAKDAKRPIKREAEAALKNAIAELNILVRVLSDADDRSQCSSAKRLVEQALGKVSQEIGDE